MVLIIMLLSGGIAGWLFSQAAISIWKARSRLEQCWGALLLGIAALILVGQAILISIVW